jgi:hypothetical protein
MTCYTCPDSGGLHDAQRKSHWFNCRWRGGHRDRHRVYCERMLRTRFACSKTRLFAPNLDFEGQVRQIFSELDKNIKAVGGRGLEDMVTMTVFITDVRNGDRLTDIRKEIFKECFPASALITVSALAAPGLLIEIQGIAVVGGK